MAKVGRPTKYKPEYCTKLLKFVDEAQPYYECPVDKQDKNGGTTTKMERVPNPPPFLSKFAREELGVNRSTLYEWAKVHEEFSNAIKKYDEMFAEFLQLNALLGNYNAAFSIFTAKNKMGWTDKVETKNEHNFPTGIQIEFTEPDEE